MPAEAFAQLTGSDSPPPASVRRPYRGLFGNSDDPNTPQSLVLSASLYGAHDDNVSAGLSGRETFDPRLQRSGEYYGATTALAYSLAKNVGRASFGVNSGVGASGYYYDERRSVVPHGQVSASASLPLGRRNTVHLNQQVAYTRYYRFLLFPSPLGGDDDGALAGDPDVELFARPAVRYGTSVGFSHSFGSRSSLSFTYNHHYVDYLEDEFAGWRSQGAGIHYDRRLTAHATLNLGYGYNVGSSIDGERRDREVHNLNVGLNYSRALSISRRTSISFSTGSAILVRDDLNLPGTDPRANFRLLGNAQLTHELGRTWTAQAAYHRGLMFREGFDDPFLTDGVTAAVGGFVTRRLDLSVVGRWSLATLDRAGRNGHDSMAASAQARFALAQFVALFARYVYYEYEFDADVPLDSGLPRSLDRRGVRVGITASLPLIR
jgi:hypothetical protein